MKANEANLLTLLNRPQQFIIPIYQRTYSWKEKQCDQLLKDILRISHDEKSSGHFIGSIVYFQEGIYTSTAIPQRLVIDGQQRLTTILLIFAALLDVVKENNLDIDITEKKIRNYYFFNTDEEGNLRYKLLLTRKDKQSLIDILESNKLDDSISKVLLRNYHFFQSKITKENAKRVFSGLQRLLIVDVALDFGKDNPQLIFESMNSTGMDLSQADLIRNYVLMGLQPAIQKEMYEKYWYPTEKLFGDRYSELFDLFIRDYLTLKTGVISRIDTIYEEFKKLVQINSYDVDIDMVLSELYSNAKNYAQFVLIMEDSKKLRQLFVNLESMKVNVAYPFLLYLYQDYIKGILLEEDFIEIVNYIESYVYRRAICGIPNNSLNKTFATFWKHIDKDKYLESVKIHFLFLESYRRYPGDNEFKQQFLIKDLYNTRLIKYALDKIENYNRKERVNVNDYTIEHIMPQNPLLSLDWQKLLGDDWKAVHEKYLHTIGNLTLTGYNSELSDNSFVDKKNMKGGFADSPIRLNEELGSLSKWDEEEILKRGETICNKALNVWKFPQMDSSLLERYKKSKAYVEKIPHNLVELIESEPEIVPAPSNIAYIRFKPKFLLNLKSKLVERKYFEENHDLIRSCLFWYEFRVTKDRIRFAFHIGNHPDQEARKRVYDVFCRYTHYFPKVDRTLSKSWHTIYSRDLITSDEYEMYDDEDHEELLELITERFREVLNVDLPKINEVLMALIEQ